MQASMQRIYNRLHPTKVLMSESPLPGWTTPSDYFREQRNDLTCCSNHSVFAAQRLTTDVQWTPMIAHTAYSTIVGTFVKPLFSAPASSKANVVPVYAIKWQSGSNQVAIKWQYSCNTGKSVCVQRSPMIAHTLTARLLPCLKPLLSAPASSKANVVPL